LLGILFYSYDTYVFGTFGLSVIHLPYTCQLAESLLFNLIFCYFDRH
jgi:hypothetical protein